MITITHGKYATKVTSDTDPVITDFRDVHRYAIGFSKPNYPMPAKYDDYSNPNVWDCVLGYHVNFG